MKSMSEIEEEKRDYYLSDFSWNQEYAVVHDEHRKLLNTF